MLLCVVELVLLFDVLDVLMEDEDEDESFLRVEPVMVGRGSCGVESYSF